MSLSAPEVSLATTFLHIVHRLLELPPVSADKPHRSRSGLDGSTVIWADTVGHLVRFDGAAAIGLDVVISVLLLPAVSILVTRLPRLQVPPSLPGLFPVAVRTPIAGPADTFVAGLAALLTDTASFSTLVSLAGIPHCVHGREFVRIKLTAGRHLVSCLGRLEEVDEFVVNINFFQTAVEAGGVSQMPQFEGLLSLAL